MKQDTLHYTGTLQTNYGANWFFRHTLAHNKCITTFEYGGSASYPEVYGVLVDTDTS